MCVSGCPYKKIYYNWKTGKAEKCIFCYPRIEAGSRRSAARPASAASATWACCCTTPTASKEAASVEHDRDLYQAQLDIFLDPNDPKVIAQARD